MAVRKIAREPALKRTSLAKYLVATCLALIPLWSCSGRHGDDSNTTATNTNRGLESTVKVKLTSPAFQEGGMIPGQYTCDGQNISPPLRWDSLPAGAKTIALVADDPDAPGKTWVHWLVFDIPASVKGLPENVPVQDVVGGGKQGANDFGKPGYGGPCPPGGTHRYHFKVYALDAELGLDRKTTEAQLVKAMEGHILAQGELMGRYKR